MEEPRSGVAATLLLDIGLGILMGGDTGATTGGRLAKRRLAKRLLNLSPS
jgi:hypothetical protein